MTEPKPHADELPLPGLEDLDTVRQTRTVSSLEAAVRRTIRAHAADGHLDEHHAAAAAIAVELCAIVTAKQATRRLSTASNDLRLLWEVVAAMDPAATDPDADAALRDAMAEWTAAVEAEANAAHRSGNG